MLNLNGKEIENLLKKAWKKFVEYYDKKAPKYSKSYSKSLNRKKEDREEHWICWNESDLMVQLGRYFYEQLPKNSNIEMHFDKNLSKSNFTDYEWKEKLEDLKTKLGRVPKLDLIITQEDSPGRFKLCAEAKYFHYSEESMSRQKKTVEKLIQKDIKTLLTIRDLGIADNVVFIMFDDYYWIHDPKKNKKIESILAKSRKKLTVLDHNSEAKIN
jgi:hypothetical protein